MQLKRKYDSFFPDQVSCSPQSSHLKTSWMTKMSLPLKLTSISGQAYLLLVVVVGVVVGVVVVVVVSSIVVVGVSVGAGEGSGQ